MPTLHFDQADGSRLTIDAPLGVSLMEAARQNAVPGVIAQCGGACACATCHVYVEGSRVAALDPPEDMELGMLESAWEPRINSRLACQVAVTAALDGLVVTVPSAQAV